MTLAARCPSCGTVFRVVQDQLRVSDGWVRCGRCGEVFNAVQNLVDLEVDVAVPRRPAAGEPEAGMPAEPAVRNGVERGAGDSGFEIEDVRSEPIAAVAPDGDADEARPVEAPGPRADADDGEPPVAGAAAGSSRQASAEPARAPQPAAADDAGDPGNPGDAPDTVLDPAPTPDFVRHADAKARWRRPVVRAALALVCVAGAAGLAAQAAHEWRDVAAARWPASRPLLEALCRAPCSIGAPRDIESLSVESSSLVRVDGSSLYQLQLQLRNRSDLPLAVPALDLTLSDTRGAVVARRVLTPDDAGVAATALQPAADLPIQLTLATAGRPIAGYTIEIFYP